MVAVLGKGTRSGSSDQVVLFGSLSVIDRVAESAWMMTRMKLSKLQKSDRQRS